MIINETLDFIRSPQSASTFNRRLGKPWTNYPSDRIIELAIKKEFCYNCVRRAFTCAVAEIRPLAGKMSILEWREVCLRKHNREV